MKLETKIAYLILCLALPLTTACKKTPIPAEDPQPAEVAFAASSQATWVKTTTGEEQPEFPYDNFGVWGIARQEGLLAPYVLWGTNSLMLVKEDEDVFVPSEAAYWLKGYTYNFLAVAPFFEDDKGFNLTPISPSTSSGEDVMTFAFDISNRYKNGKYDFDLLGAADQTYVDKGGYNTAQELTFWHLLSQIEIKSISFASGINGTVNKIVLKSFPSATYTISYDNGSNNSTKPTGVSCNSITQKSNGESADKVEATFLNPDFSVSHPVVNIIPQAVANLELYIDFTITQNAIEDKYKDFKINLNTQNLTEYVYNGKYNWSITIGARNAITFDVTATPWQDVNVPDEYPLT